ncbi:MAG TPA: hypothetical protein VK866_15500 [Acidimicrobiales bacterium]|nr:hypothetical protein [Acidimicrobiales bacterium]
MAATLSSTVVLACSTLTALVGVVATAFDRAFDLTAVFALIAVLQAMLLIRLRTHRTEVTLRPDLAAWVLDRAALTGEPAEHLLDRCVATARDHLGSSSPGPSGSGRAPQLRDRDGAT